jgi:hypothetical protein
MKAKIRITNEKDFYDLQTILFELDCKWYSTGGDYWDNDGYNDYSYYLISINNKIMTWRGYSNKPNFEYINFNTTEYKKFIRKYKLKKLNESNKDK